MLACKQVVQLVRYDLQVKYVSVDSFKNICFELNSWIRIHLLLHNRPQNAIEAIFSFQGYLSSNKVNGS